MLFIYYFNNKVDRIKFRKYQSMIKSRFRHHHQRSHKCCILLKKKYFALDLALNMSKKHMYVSDLSPRVCALLLAEIDVKSEKSAIL